jgi:peptidylprolyl isomerase
VGTIGDTPGWIPDRMNTVEIAADMDEAERPTVQVLRTDHPAFQSWLKTRQLEDGSFPDICNLEVPTRVL